MYHSTLGSRVIKKKRRSSEGRLVVPIPGRDWYNLNNFTFEIITVLALSGPEKGNSKLSWREAGPLNHLDDMVDSDQ